MTNGGVRGNSVAEESDNGLSGWEELFAAMVNHGESRTFCPLTATVWYGWSVDEAGRVHERLHDCPLPSAAVLCG